MLFQTTQRMLTILDHVDGPNHHLQFLTNGVESFGFSGVSRFNHKQCDQIWRFIGLWTFGIFFLVTLIINEF